MQAAAKGATGDGPGSNALMYTQLKKFISVIDDLRDVGVQKFVRLPRIAVLGS